MALDLNQLRELLAAINQTDISELTLKSEDFELVVRRGARADNPLLPEMARSVPTAEVMTVTSVAPPPPPVSPEGRDSQPPAPTPTALPPTNERRWVEVLSPMVGTFYRAPAPDEPPFVDVGDRIRTGQTVCIIEAMKLMNEIEAEVAGEVLEILVQNGEPVEYEQPLMRVAPG